MRHHIVVASSLLLLGVAGVAASRSPETPGAVPVVPRMLIPPDFGISAERVAVHGAKYYLLDGTTHRVMVINETRAVERQIGQIGQDAGAFYHPSELGFDRAGQLYVLDNVGSRVQIMSHDGAVVGGFNVEGRISGFAVTPAGHVIVGDPQRNTLMAELDRSGRVVRRFGEMRRMSDFYGPEVRDLDTPHRIAANRAVLAVDDSDNVYVGFANAPVFQKYDKDRRLVFERKLEGTRAETIFRKFRETRLWPARHGYGGDAASGPLITTGIAANSQTGTIYISFLWEDSYVYIADRDGNPRAVLEGTKQPLRLNGVTVDPARSLLVSPRLAMVKQLRTYEISPQSFGWMMRNPIYMGRIESCQYGVSTTGDFEPLVEAASSTECRRCLMAVSSWSDRDHGIIRTFRCVDSSGAMFAVDP